MLKRLVSFAAVAMLALVVLAACGGDGEEEDVTRIPNVPGAPPTPTREAAAASPAAEGAASPGASPMASPPAGPEATTPTTGTPPEEAVTVQMLDIRFEPAEFTIPANTDVTVTLPNNGAAPHNFNIDQLNVHSETAQGGQTVEVTINAQPGDYEYYCAVPGHKAAGMVGTLHVQ